MLFELLQTLRAYMQHYGAACHELMEKGWRCAVSIKGVKYILGRDDDGAPVTLTLYSSALILVDECLAEMIRPKGQYGKSQSIVDLNSFGWSAL